MKKQMIMHLCLVAILLTTLNVCASPGGIGDPIYKWPDKPLPHTFCNCYQKLFRSERFDRVGPTILVVPCQSLRRTTAFNERLATFIPTYTWRVDHLFTVDRHTLVKLRRFIKYILQRVSRH